MYLKKGKIKDFFKPYAIIIFVYFTFYLVCNAIYKAEISNPSLISALSETKENLYWGFFTYMFVHDSYSHLFNNMQSIILSTILFILLLFFNSFQNPKNCSHLLHITICFINAYRHSLHFFESELPRCIRCGICN